MKALLASLLIFFSAFSLRAGGPTLDAGLSVHMIPDRFAHLDGGGSGFVIFAPIGNQAANAFHTAKELFDYLRAQPKTALLNIPRNGLWIYIDGPDDYSPGSIKEYNKLLSLCAESHIPVSLSHTIWRPAMPSLHQKP